MRFLNLLSTAALLVCGVSATPNATSSYYYPGVPTDRPTPGNYTSYLRPRVHFTPARYFMNDPNGMHRDAEGLWHMYYQYNPTTPVAGNQHWGHATSTDLYTWELQKIAVWPPNNFTYIFSGSAVVDANNTSGFFPNQTNGVVAIYTLAEYPYDSNGVQYQGIQAQAISYSRDGGYTFEAYSGNPVIDVGSTQFRDPYVIWHEASQNWVLVLAYAEEFVVGIYTSPNLRDWTHASNFTKHGWLGVQYECPNLRQMPMQGSAEPVWYMQISINPGAPLGGSVSQYFVGDFNGTHFVPYDAATRLINFGKDNYAGQFFNEVPGNEPQISIGWASNWQYTQLVPTGLLENGQFRSAMSVPRTNVIANITLQGYDLVSEIYNISSTFDQELMYNTSVGNSTKAIPFGDVESGAIYFEANVTNLTSTLLQGSINFTISSTMSGEYIQGGTDIGGNAWINRGNIRGFDNPYFTDKFSQEGSYGPSNNGTWSISLVYDRSVLELFLNGGQQGCTLSFFPLAPLDVLTVTYGGIASNASSVLAVWGLIDPWASQANATGTVNGNVTGAMSSYNMSSYMF